MAYRSPIWFCILHALVTVAREAKGLSVACAVQIKGALLGTFGLPGALCK